MAQHLSHPAYQVDGVGTLLHQKLARLDNGAVGMFLITPLGDQASTTQGPAGPDALAYVHRRDPSCPFPRRSAAAPARLPRALHDHTPGQLSRSIGNASRFPEPPARPGPPPTKAVQYPHKLLTHFAQVRQPFPHSQAITGTDQGGLVLPGNTWNQHPFGIMDYTTGVFRYFWSCGNPDGICVGHATSSQTFLDGEPVSVNNPSPSVCDIQDPGIVKFNGTYYLYAAGIVPGAPPNAGCNGTGNEHAAIYAFSSSDGVHFSPLNGGHAVIQVSVDPCYTCYTGHGINGPSPVVMGAGTFIRVYYFINAPGYNVVSGASGIEAQDSYNGVTFSNERAIMANGAYWPSVKRVGLHGDYPMVMTFTNGSGAFTATSSSSGDTSWTIGNKGASISTTPAYSYPPRLESDQTGLFLNANGGAFTSPVSGQVNFDWDNGVGFVFGTRIYRGSGIAAQFFTF